MLKIATLPAYLFMTWWAFCYPQQSKLVKWQCASSWITKNEHLLLINASVEPGWHLYSQFVEEGGPKPTIFTFDNRENYSLIGKTEEQGNAKEYYDSIFDMKVKSYSGIVTFKQKLHLKSDQQIIFIKVKYMVCNKEMCVPSTDGFQITISNN